MVDLKFLSLNDLLSKLHSAIEQFIEDIDELADENKAFALSDIKDIRNRTKEKIEKGDDPIENARLLKLLNLFVADKTFIELTKEDVEEWVDFLDAIENSVSSGKVEMNGKEKEELKEIKELTGEIKALIRK